MTDQDNSNQQNNNQDAAAVDPQNLPQAAIQRVYIKDLSFEAPNLPDMFTVEYKPKTVFLVEVQQAGVFLIKNVNQEQLQHALSVMGPETLYPYVRETIAGLIGKTGFPSIQIAPVNFQALFLQKLQEAQANGDQAASANNEPAGGATIQ